MERKLTLERIKNSITYRVNHLFRTSFFKLFPSKKLDLPRFLHSINNLEYLVIKTQVPYIPRQFPKEYPFGRDLDIIALPKDFKTLINKTLEFAKKHPHFKLKILREEENILISFIFLGHMHYQIDITSSIKILGDKFIASSIKERKSFKGMYIPSKEFELIYRIYELNKDKSKKHHRDYILSHLGDLNLNLIKSGELKKFAKNLEYEK